MTRSPTDASPQDLLSPELLSRIGDYALMAQHAVDGYLAGSHFSTAQGQGSEFVQYRNAVPGDDLKGVDWKVYARQNRLYTKIFQEETGMRCAIVVDASASMAYQGDRAVCSKFRYAAMAAACLAWLAKRQGDHVGLFAYTSTLQTGVRRHQTDLQLPALLASLAGVTPSGVGCHEQALGQAAEFAAPRGLLVWLSDMQAMDDNLPRLLRLLRGRHLECIAFQIADPDELDLPFQGTARFIDSETGEAITAVPAAIRQEYQRQVAQFHQSVRDACLTAETDYTLLQTDQSLADALTAYLHHRKGRTS